MSQEPVVLLHLGLHKCASTWLQKNVFSRGDLGIASPWNDMAHLAVTEFVDVDPLCFDAAALRQKFDDACADLTDTPKVLTVSHEALSSRPHHGRYHAPHVADRLKAVFPSGKVLLIFREQSSIITSLYGEYIRNGGRNSFAEFVGTGDEPGGWAPLCKMSFFEYDRLIKMYQQVFGAENVLALPLELLRNAPKTFTQRLFDFMGVADPDLQTDQKTNAGWSPLTFEIYRRTNGFVRKNPLGPNHGRLYNVRQFIAWRLDRILPSSWSTRIKKKHSAILTARVEGRFERSNAEVSEMIGIDLKELGYA